MKASYYNNLPKALVKSLKKDEIVMYRLTEIKPDPHNEGRQLMPASMNVPPSDEVYDEKSETYIPIAYITKVDPNGEAVFGDITFEARNAGFIILKGSNPSHAKIYQYLELSNYNASNKNRATGKSAFFKRVDEEADAKAKRETRRADFEAMDTAINMTSEDVNFVASALGMNMKYSEAVLRNQIEEYAQKNPKKFLAVASQKTNKVEALLREAVKLKILRHSADSSKFGWSDKAEALFTYKKTTGSKPYREFAEHLQANDSDTLSAIEVRVEAEKDNP